MDNLLKFAERLSELLTERGMKPAHLARELGVTRAVIGRYVNGEHLPSLDMAVRLSACFGCSIDFLLGRSDAGSDFTPLPPPPFRERLTFLLTFFRTTKYRLIREAGLDESTVYDWQSGRITPGLNSLIALAEHFGCSVEFVLGRED